MEIEESTAATKENPKEKALSYCLKNIRRIINKDLPELQRQRVEALQFFDSDPKIVPHGTRRSKYTTTDLSDMIEEIIPDLLKIFAGNEDVVSLNPQNAEDVEGVKNMNELINYQLKRKNKWFLLLNDFFRDALILKVGVFKYQWYKETKNIDKEYIGLTDEEFQAKIADENTQVISHEAVIEQEAVIDGMGMQVSPAVSTHNVTLRYSYEDEYPKIDVVNPEDVGFSLEAQDIQDEPFVYHRVYKRKWDIIRDYGKEIWDDIEDTKNSNTSTDSADADSVFMERFRDLNFADFFYDKTEDKYWFYECYYLDVETGNPMITTICGDVIAKHEENKYKVPPFRVASPYKLSHRAIGRGLHDMLRELMKIRTSLTRQMLDNIYFTNNGRYVVDDTQIKLDDLVNNNFAGGIVRGNVNGGVATGIASLAPPALQMWSFQVFEYFQQEKDRHSPIPRSYTGANPDAMNKTFRGQAQQVQQGARKLEMMARTFAEMAIAPLVSDIMNLNMQFMQKKTAVRILNTYKELSPDNICNKADVIVNVGIGTGDKNSTIMYMQQLLGLFAQIKKAGVPILQPENVYNAMKELITAMGYRNIADFITDPKETQALAQLAVELQKHIMQMQQMGLPVDPALMQAMAIAAQATGIQTPQIQQPQGNEGQLQPMPPPPQPSLPMNPMNPQTMIPQGEYFG